MDKYAKKGTLKSGSVHVSVSVSHWLKKFWSENSKSINPADHLNSLIHLDASVETSMLLADDLDQHSFIYMVLWVSV